MKTKQILSALVIFLAGVWLGGAVAPSLSHAQSGEIDWSTVVNEPGFRAAVIDVINACLVDNGIIYCE